MLRVRASSAENHVTTSDGHTVTLTSRSWRAAVDVGPVGLTWTYRRPASVELSRTEGAPLRVRTIDYPMVARIAAVLLLLVAGLTRRRHR